MGLGYQDFLNAARKEVQELSFDEALALGNDAIWVDIRDIREVKREGKIAGSEHAPRGMLEFWIDPASPYHKPVFAQDKTYIFFCASGWRSLLAAQTAQIMGLKSASLSEGFAGWKTSGRPVEQV